MTNICSPSLAHNAHQQSPTRPQSSSPSLNTSAELNSNLNTTITNTSPSVLINSSAMQQLIENNSSTNLINIDQNITSSKSSLDKSPKQSNNLENERHSENDDNSQNINQDNLDDEQLDKQSSIDSRTRTAVNSPKSFNHLNSSINSLSPQSNKDNDRKELEEILTKKDSKIKQLEDQLAKQQDYEQIKHELNLLKEQISLLRNEKPLDLLLALDKSRSIQNENSSAVNNVLSKQILPQNMNMFTSLLGEDLFSSNMVRRERSSITPTENNMLFANNSATNLLDSKRISPNLRTQSVDDLKHNSNSNQSLNQHNLAGLTADSFTGLDNELLMAKNNPSISQLTTSISNSLLASANNPFLSNPQSTTPTNNTSSSSSLQIPQLDPMLTVTTPAAQAALTKLTEKLRHNVDVYMNKNLDTANISRCVRDLLSVHNIGQRLFAKYVLGLSQGTVSELLSKPKQWDKLTEKGRDSYRKMHAWASDENCIYWLKFLVPKKGKEVYNTSMISSSMTNTASMITGNTNNSSNSAIHGLAGVLGNGNSSLNNFNNSIAAALSNNNKDDLNAERLQAFLKSQGLFNNNNLNNNNGLNQSNNSSTNNAMLELMANAANQNNSQAQQQLMELLFKNQSSSSNNNNQNGNQQQANQSLNENDCSQMSDDLDSKERSMTPLDSIYKKLSNGNSQNDSMQDAMARLYQEQLTKLLASQMEDNLKQQQSNNNNSNNNNLNDKNEEIRQAFAIYQHELAKLTSGGQPSIESLSRFQNAANVVNQVTNQERLLLRETNTSRDSNSSLNEDTKGQNSQNNNSTNSNNQQSNSAFPMVKSFLNNSNNGTSNIAKNEDDSYCSSGKSTPVNNSNSSLNTINGQPEDLSLVASSPLQRIQSITNSLLTQQQYPNASTSPNRSFSSRDNINNNNQCKVILPPITQHQFDLYNNLNTDEIVKKVKDQLSQYSISQRLFGESVLGLSQGSVSDLLARPKPWHMLTQKGREPFIRMRMFLDDNNAVHKLVASQYKIAPDKLMRSGAYASGTFSSTNGSQIPSALTNELNQLSSLSALSGNMPNNAAMNALAAMENGSLSNNNPAFAAALLALSSGNRQLNLDALKLLERQQAGSPLLGLNNSLLDSTDTQRSSANSTPDRRSPALNQSANSPNSSQTSLFSNNKRSSNNLSQLNGLSTSNNLSNLSNEFNSQSLNSKLSSYNNQPQSVYEMAALTDTLDTQDVTTKIKESLMQHNIGQKIFGEVVLGLSQGSVSELLSKPKPWQMLSIKGREPFIRMKMWLTDPNNIEKLQSLKNERREANKRRRNADVDSPGFSMEKLMSGSNVGLENGSNDLYNSGVFGSNNSAAANLNNLLLANFGNSNQFNLSGNSNNFGPQSAKKPRIQFSDEQKVALKIAYKMDPYPSTTTIELLSNELQLSVRTITNWFHNHRMRLKQINSSNNNASSPSDENSSNYSLNSNGRENTSSNTFDMQQFRTLLEQRITELKLNPANTTQSTIQVSKSNSNRFQNALMYNPQIMELIRNGGGDLSSLMNSLANQSCVSPTSSNEDDYYQEDDTCIEDDDNVNDQSSLDLSNCKQQTRQNIRQHLQRRNNSEDECNYSENEDDEMQTNDLDENSNDFENNSMLEEKNSKLLFNNTSSRRKTAQPLRVNPEEKNKNSNDKQQIEDSRIRSDDESSMHSIEAQ